MLRSATGAFALESEQHPGYFIGIGPAGMAFAANAAAGEEPARFTLRAANMSPEACARMASSKQLLGGGAGAAGKPAAGVSFGGGIFSSILSSLGSALGGAEAAVPRGLGAGPGGLSLPPTDPRSHPDLRCSLSDIQLASLVHDGYCVFPGIIPRRLVWAALRRINSGMAGAMRAGGAGAAAKAGAGAGAGSLPKSDAAADTAPQGDGAGLSGKAAEEAKVHPMVSRLLGQVGAVGGVQLSQSPEILSLMWRSPAWGAVNSIVGHGQCIPPRAAQVALRFPQPPGEEESKGHGTVDWDEKVERAASSVTSAAGPGSTGLQGPDSRWHIDGMDKRTAAPFSLLVGIMLSDADHEDMGNLAVYPGTHVDVAEKIKRDGAGWVAGAAPRPPLSKGPKQVLLKAGDVVVAHPLLPHRVGVNYSPFIRYCVYFRVHHKEHPARRPRLPEDLLAVWDGVKDVVSGHDGHSPGAGKPEGAGGL